MLASREVQVWDVGVMARGWARGPAWNWAAEREFLATGDGRRVPVALWTTVCPISLRQVEATFDVSAAAIGERRV